MMQLIYVKLLSTSSRRYVTPHAVYIVFFGGRTGLVVRASDSRSGDPGSILGRVGELFP